MLFSVLGGSQGNLSHAKFPSFRDKATAEAAGSHLLLDGSASKILEQDVVELRCAWPTVFQAVVKYILDCLDENRGFLEHIQVAEVDAIVVV